MSYARLAAIRLLTLYQRTLSPLLHRLSPGGGCRFQPTCSEYALLAVSHHGAGRGSWLALRRLLRCHPACRGGFDPVPGTWPPQPAAMHDPAAAFTMEPSRLAPESRA